MYLDNGYTEKHMHAQTQSHPRGKVKNTTDNNDVILISLLPRILGDKLFNIDSEDFAIVLTTAHSIM